MIVKVHICSMPPVSLGTIISNGKSKKISAFSKSQGVAFLLHLPSSYMLGGSRRGCQTMSCGGNTQRSLSFPAASNEKLYGRTVRTNYWSTTRSRFRSSVKFLTLHGAWKELSKIDCLAAVRMYRHFFGEYTSCRRLRVDSRTEEES